MEVLCSAAHNIIFEGFEAKLEHMLLFLERFSLQGIFSLVQTFAQNNLYLTIVIKFVSGHDVDWLKAILFY